MIKCVPTYVRNKYACATSFFYDDEWFEKLTKKCIPDTLKRMRLMVQNVVISFNSLLYFGHEYENVRVWKKCFWLSCENNHCLASIVLMVSVSHCSWAQRKRNAADADVSATSWLLRSVVERGRRKLHCWKRWAQTELCFRKWNLKIGW